MAHYVYCPKITQEDLVHLPFGKLYRQDKPVLGVFGTSSRQGKFTLQLQLRSEFLKRGYAVTQVGTEPSSLLFQMDIVFPIGYHSTVYIDRKDTVSFLNERIYACSRNSDIIIVGSQSGVVIRDEGNLDNYNFVQLDFLYATQPDAVILCINIDDSNDIINRTMRFIESATDCDVIALMVFPLHYKKEDSGYGQLISLTKDEFMAYRHNSLQQFKIPVYLLGDDIGTNTLSEQIIEYFSN